MHWAQHFLLQMVSPPVSVQHVYVRLRAMVGSCGAAACLMPSARTLCILRTVRTSELATAGAFYEPIMSS